MRNIILWSIPLGLTLSSACVEYSGGWGFEGDFDSPDTSAPPDPYGLEVETASLDDGAFPTGSSTLATTADGNVIVMVERDRGLAVLNDLGNVIQRVPNSDGEQPYRVARVGDRFVVSFKNARKLVVYDLDDTGLRVARTIDTPAEPSGLVASEDGSRLYVACATAGVVLALDGETYERIEGWSVAGQPTFLALHPNDRDLFAVPVLGGAFVHIDTVAGQATSHDLPMVGRTFVGRLTSDPAISPDGRWLLFGGIVGDPTGESINDTEVVTDSYGSSSALEPEVERVMPTVTALTLDGGQSLTYTMGRPRGLVSGISFSPDGGEVIISMGPADRIVRVQERFLGSRGTRPAQDLAMYLFPASSVEYVAAGPEHVAWTATGPQLHATIDRALQSLDSEDAALLALWPELGDAEAELGRRLFHSSIDPRVSDNENSVSCSTCHFEGRADGLTWTVRAGMTVQTPSLTTATHTAPYTWMDSVATVADEAEITAIERLGATSGTESDAIEAYVATLQPPDVPVLGLDSDEIELGEALFHSPEVGCDNCHSGEWFTDGLEHLVNGESYRPFATPTLVGIAATPPYFHDGSAATLREVVDRSEDGTMGYTGDLSNDERDALVTYLRSL